MAKHKCPECGADCYCQGDMESIFIDLPEETQKCVHWLLCQGDNLPVVEDTEDDSFVSLREIAESMCDLIREKNKGWTDEC